MKLSEALCKKSEMLNVRDVIKVSDGLLASDQLKKVICHKLSKTTLS